jgi:hypothetical protein
VVIKRSFSTKLQPVEAFGLSNEVLRPVGFELGKANPPRSQEWRRGGGTGSKAGSLRNTPLAIEIEVERNRVNLTAKAEVAERSAGTAKNMLSAFAQALELVLAEGASPEAVRALMRNAEHPPRTGSKRTLVSVCVIVFSVLGGGFYFATTMKSVPGPVKWVLAKFATGGKSPDKGHAATSGEGGSSDKPKKSPPVIVVRRAGAQTNVQSHTESPR